MYIIFSLVLKYQSSRHMCSKHMLNMQPGNFDHLHERKTKYIEKRKAKEEKTNRQE